MLLTLHKKCKTRKDQDAAAPADRTVKDVKTGIENQNNNNQGTKQKTLNPLL